MKLVFNMAFDGELWPGPLGYGDTGRDAVVDEDWVGPHGLLRHMETQLGLGGLLPSQDERDTALIEAVRATRGFWSPSAEVDPFATARTLRRWRDHLVLRGWEPERADARRRDRVSALARVTRDLLPGLPDRLREVVREVAPGRLEIQKIQLLGQPRAALPALLSRLLDVVQDTGVRVVDVDLAPAERPGRTDLARCFEKKVKPRFDGSLQLLRPAGPQAAAEVVAVWLAELADRDELTGTVVVGSGAMLDTALQARGVPTTGGPSAADGDPLLSLLPLSIQLGWGPTDPQTALDLLLLPELPIAPGLAASLADALCESPAIGSDDWERNRSRYLANCDNATTERLQGWLDRLFRVNAEGEDYPAAAIQDRIRDLETWARGRAGRDEFGRYEAFAGSCVLLRRKLEKSGMESLTEPQLERLLGETVSAAGERWEAQAGLHRIAGPDALAGPAERVVWWGFTRDSTSMPWRPLLSADERTLLESQGAVLPRASDESGWVRDGWLRPFEQTRGELCLVTPLVDSAGETAFPHPVWDEVLAQLGTAGAGALECSSPRGIAASLPQPALLLPTPAGVWEPELDESLAAPKKLSPSSIAPLLGCAVRSALERDVGVAAALPASLPTDTLLAGRYAHRLLEALLRDFVGQPLPDPDTLGRLAGEVFDRQAPRLVSAWFRRGEERTLAARRAGFVAAAAALARCVGPGGPRVAAVEQRLERRTRRYRLSGRADLVLDTPSSIIDFKWWGKGSLKKALSRGTAYQLAAYAWAATTGRAPLPAVAYFFIDSPELASTSETAFADASVFGGPEPAETMAALRRAVDEALSERAKGRFVCGGTPDDPEDLVGEHHVDEGDCLRLAPPCRFCDFDGLCALGGVR